MGYRHINNLYRDTTILMFKQCYAMEKVHGTSANISWKDNKLMLHGGGMGADTFKNIPDFQFLENRLLEEFDGVDIIIYGEAYGGKQQKMSHTYGAEPAFIVFEVMVGEDAWLNVENAHDVAAKLNLEFVPYHIVDATVEVLNAQRDLPSEVAVRRGCGSDKLREGIVCKPLFEFRDNRGNRVIVKHKGDTFMETKTPREINPEQLKILEKANDIADEWVTEMRLDHVLDAIENPTDITDIRAVIAAMIEDVTREGKGEIVDSVEARKAISKKAALMYKKRISKI